MSPEDDEIIYRGPITLDPPVRVGEIGQEHAALLSCEPVISCTYTTGGAGQMALTGIVVVDEVEGWAGYGTWWQILSLMQTIARRTGRTLHTSATFDSDERGRGTLVVDHGGRFHDCQDADSPDFHRARSCDCFGGVPAAGGLRPVEITEDGGISITEAAAGPFTDFVVSCIEHGEVASLTTLRDAQFRREAHIVDEHTARPLPLGLQAAWDLLPPAVVEHIENAAEALRRGRGFDPALAIQYRDSARVETRKAVAALTESELEDSVSVLLRALVEMAAK